MAVKRTFELVAWEQLPVARPRRRGCPGRTDGQLRTQALKGPADCQLEAAARQRPLRAGQRR